MVKFVLSLGLKYLKKIRYYCPKCKKSLFSHSFFNSEWMINTDLIIFGRGWGWRRHYMTALTNHF